MSHDPTSLPALPASTARTSGTPQPSQERKIDTSACAHYLRDLADTLRTTSTSTSRACNLAYVWSVDLVHALSYAPAALDTVAVRVAVEKAASAWETSDTAWSARALEAARVCEELAGQVDAGVALAELGRDVL